VYVNSCQQDQKPVGRTAMLLSRARVGRAAVVGPAWPMLGASAVQGSEAEAPLIRTSVM